MNQHNVNIAGNDYTINAFKAEQGFLLKARLLKIAAPALAALKTVAEDADLVAVVAAIVSGVADQMDEVATLDLIKQLFSGVYKGNSQKVNFDTEFAQNYSAIYLLLAEVIKFNYKDVFQTLGITIAE